MSDPTDEPRSAAQDSDKPTRPTPTPQLPPAPPRGGGGAGFLAIGAIALLLAVVTYVMLRGMSFEAEAPPVAATTSGAQQAPEDLPDVDLVLFVERDGKAEPLAPGTDVQVGDRLMFELASEAPAPVRLWIEEDGLMIEDLGTIDADQDAAMIGAEDGMLAWGFGHARTVTVRASAARRGCPAASCASQVVVAR